MVAPKKKSPVFKACSNIELFFQPIIIRPTEDSSLFSSRTLTYVSMIVGPLLFCLLVGLMVLASMMKKQRSLHGTYNPQKQEIHAPRLEMTEMFKVPPEERLIWSNHCPSALQIHSALSLLFYQLYHSLFVCHICICSILTT